ICKRFSCSTNMQLFMYKGFVFQFSLIGTPELKKWLWSAYVLPLLELVLP
ncbi:Os04g0282000, partial [Oryza sativa Japonica Group]